MCDCPFSDANELVGISIDGHTFEMLCILITLFTFIVISKLLVK